MGNASGSVRCSGYYYGFSIYREVYNSRRTVDAHIFAQSTNTRFVYFTERQRESEREREGEREIERERARERENCYLYKRVLWISQATGRNWCTLERCLHSDNERLWECGNNS